MLRAMPGPSSTRLPKVILSSVVRSAHKGESHGGVYLVDLETEKARQVLDWNDPTINWEGRGADRGLRGIAFHRGCLYLAASDEIFVYDAAFRRQGSFKNRYLNHCHEITIAEGSLYATSTGFDSVLEYDLGAGAFRRGYCLRLGSIWRWPGRQKLGLRPRPTFRIFDPNGEDGPSPGDTCHINSAHVEDGALYVCGTRLGNVWRIEGSRLSRYARVPHGSHNARPFRDGVLLNHTATDRIAFMNRRGRVLRSFPLKAYEDHELVHGPLPRDVARQAFGRGLAIVTDQLIVGGSSPSTITVYRFDPPSVVKSINVTMDVRNAVHGLEVWPLEGEA